MGEFKKVGSEKLSGDEKLKRILELTYKNLNQPSTKLNENFDVVETRKVNNEVFGLVKERDGYYIKKGLNESSLEYIGGLFMKNKNRYDSYSDGIKRLDYLVGQTLSEQKKYFLKTPEKIEPQLPEPSNELPLGTTEPSSDETSMDMGNETIDEPINDKEKVGDVDPLKEINKMTGKLSEALRKAKRNIESDDIKYVINSILSAFNLSILNDEDKDDIIKRFEKVSKENPTPQTDETDSDIDKELGEMFNKLSGMVKSKTGKMNESFRLSNLID